MPTIYLAEPGGQPTSYSEEQALQLWQQGALSPTTLYWKEGLPDWRPAAELLGQISPVATDTIPAPLAPVAAPVAAPPRGAAPVAGRYAPGSPSMRLAKDPTGLTLFVKVMMWIVLSLAVVAVAVSGFYLAQGVAAQSNSEQFTPKDAINLVVGLLQLLAMLGTTIPFCMWVHLANRNARALTGGRGMQFTPGWAVGWYFIPFANLWKPYQAMKEIWLVSHNPRAPGAEPPASLVSNWWGLWLLTNFLSQASFRMSMRSETPQALFNSELVSLCSDLTDIGLCLVAIRMISTICRKQLEWAQRGG